MATIMTLCSCGSGWLIVRGYQNAINHFGSLTQHVYGAYKQKKNTHSTDNLLEIERKKM